MDTDLTRQIRKLNQAHAYTTIHLHEAVGRKAGLPGTDHKYLGFLLQKGPMTAGELAALSGLTTGAVTGLIDRFEKKHLVKRQFDKNDRRKVIIAPNTQKIMALLEPLYKEYRRQSELLIASFSAQDLHAIERYLSKSIDIMNETMHTLNDK